MIILTSILTGCENLDDTKPSDDDVLVAIACNPVRVLNTVFNAPDIGGALPIDRDHIFCGEVTGNRAKGFHSQPGG